MNPAPAPGAVPSAGPLEVRRILSGAGWEVCDTEIDRIAAEVPIDGLIRLVDGETARLVQGLRAEVDEAATEAEELRRDLGDVSEARELARDDLIRALAEVDALREQVRQVSAERAVLAERCTELRQAVDGVGAALRRFYGTIMFRGWGDPAATTITLLDSITSALDDVR